MDNLLNYLLFDDDDENNWMVAAGVAIENLVLPANNHERNIPTRNEGYFEQTIPKYNLEEFKTHFRMSKECFQELLRGVVSHLKNNTFIPNEKKMLFTLWQLAKPESFVAASDRFGIAKSTGHYIFLECIEAICHLKEQLIKWPSQQECIKTAQFIETCSGIPGVVGSIDGTHISIKQPVNNAVDFYNRKEHHSVILQAVCNEKKILIDIFVGMPGKVHDARVFRNSPLFTRLTNDPSLLPPNQHLLGDAAYPLLTNLMRPYRDNGHLNERQRRFNQRLSSQRVVIEMTYGLLKGKWRRLKYLDMSLQEKIPEVICACCILHNFLLKFNSNEYDDERVEQDENMNENDDNDESDEEGNERYGGGAIKRDYLATLLI